METAGAKLPDIMFELKVTLQKMLAIKVEEEFEILVGSNMRGKSMLKSPRRKIFFEFSLLSFSNSGSIISFVKLFTCRDRCL